MSKTILSNKYEALKYIKTVAVYLRRSRGDLDEDLQKHSKIIYEFVNKHKWKYVEYKEIKTGSSIAEREEMQYLLRDVKEELFDAVVVFDYDRLGRGSATDQERIQNTLRNNNTLVITLSPFEIYDLNNESDEDWIEFKGFMARQEYKLITKRLQAGKKIGARMGHFVYGVPPYGYEYKAELKGLVVNEKEKKNLRYMMDSYLNGSSLNKIATELNQKKIPSPGGKRWHGNTIKYILTNDIYLGKIISNKSSGVRPSNNPDGTKKPYREHPKDEWIVVNNCHEPIFTEEEIGEVREILRSRTNHRNGNGKNALSGLVKCSICGKTMTIQKEKNYTALKKCTNCGQNKGGDALLVEDLLNYRMKQIKDVLIENKQKRKPNKDIKKIDDRITELRKETITHNEAIERIRTAYEDGDGLYTDINEVKDRIKDRRNKIADINEEISYLSKRKDSLTDAKKTNKIKVIQEFYEKLEKDNTPAETNDIYKNIIEKVEWTRLNNDNINIKIFVK